MTGRSPLLEARGLSKTFFGQPALDEVSFSVVAGEVHALVGHNGSGKSTLIKILAGYHSPDHGSGEVAVAGNELRFGHPEQSRRLGLRFIHQDLGLVPDLTVLENLYLGRTFDTAFGRRIRWRRERQAARQTLARVGLDVDPETVTAMLSPIQRTQLAVARALSEEEECRVLFLDEPTAVLPNNEVDALFDLIRNALQQGIGVVYVSHRLEELEVIADRITVLRDGRVAGAGPVRGFTNDQLVKLIVGADHVVAPEVEQRRQSSTALGDVCLEFENVAAGELVDASFAVRSGEVVGLAGLTGSGIDDVAPVLQRRIPLRSGRVAVGADRADITSGGAPADLVRRGVAVLPSERALKSFPTMTVRENLTLPALARFWRGGRLRLRSERKAAKAMVEEFNVLPARPDAELLELSGGNQQKVNLAKWLKVDPKVMVLAEPTQGVDVGGKEEILALVRNAARDGAGVLVCSTDVYELESVCSRVLVVRDGRIAAELTGSRVDARQISEECYGGSVANVD